MTYQEAIDKAAKLLRLANGAGATPAEAALAASRAQEIMDKFQIESAVAEYAINGDSVPKPEEPIADYGKGEDAIDGGGATLATWRTRLCSSVARANGCRIYLTHRRDAYGRGRRAFGLVGRASDVATVRYFYAFLERQIEALAARDVAGHGRSWGLNYRIGVVETIDSRLAEQHATTQREALAAVELTGSEIMLAATRGALAKLERRGDETAAWMKTNMHLRSGSGSGYTYNGEARQAGRAAGREIRFGAARGSLCAS